MRVVWRIVDLEALVVLSILASTLGVSWIVKDYIASFLAGLIIRVVKQIRPGRRIKVFTTPPIKGDVVKIGLFRTSLIEVGDGERLPSIRTGRILQVFNMLLMNNPVLIYKEDDYVDEVVAYVKYPCSDIGLLKELMRESIIEEGMEPLEVGIYQRPDLLVIRGMYRSKLDSIIDLRSSILESFLGKVQREIHPAATPS
ncbi:MAG: hypothetical protein QXE79_01685 [Candidatus Bathyarchaeia archaeon]